MAPGSDDLSHVHEPVLVQEVLAYLALERMPTGLVVDGTVGAGGHATAILHAHPETRLVGLDRDPEILTHAAARLAPFGDRAQLVHGSYADLDQVLMERALPAPAGILLDVGVSSLQLDDLSRGFSFKGEGALPDMRFDPTGEEQTAADLVNHASERELADILHFHGEEPRARAVARAIVHARPITTIGQLREVVRRSAFRVRRHDAATRSFQALRIAVNDELGQLDALLAAIPRVLAPQGRAAIISFHSLEDRRVKQAFRALAGVGAPRDPYGHPVTPPWGRLLTRKAVKATDDNPRARSARLRGVQRASAPNR